MTAAFVRDADSSAVRLSVPTRGRVLTTVAETYGKPIREAIQTLTRSLARERPALPGWLSREVEIDAQAAASPASHWELGARHICTQWVVGISLGELTVSDDFAAASEWFAGDSEDSLLSLVYSISEGYRGRALSHLRAAATPDAWADLLPYILDPHGPGSRLSVMRDPSTRATRDQKRNEGSFFTPADVAEFMVESVIGGLKIGNELTVLDPACGTGVFLRAALAALRERQPAKDPAVIAENLFGIDVDRWAVHASAYVLLHDLRGDTHSRDSRPYATWQRLRKNLHVGDALDFDPPTCGQKDSSPLTRIFPTLDSGPNVIVGNPPYARLGDRADLLRLARRYQTLRPASSTAEIHPLFVEQTIRLAAPNAAAALVLPLSIGFNTRPQFVATRRLIERTAGTWQFSFFDREPHALFGEDVKTRNTVLTWTRDQDVKANTVMTAPLLKWRGNSRARMFRSIRHTRINHSITGGIPKVGGAIEANALDALWRRNAILGVCVSDIRSCPLKGVFDADDASVLVASTAYNFINAYLKPPKEFKGIGALSDNKVHQLQFLRPDDAYAAYAMLSSRTAFWLWRVLGDGFHVTRTNIEKIPLGMSLFGPDERGRLAKLGQAMWQEAKISPLVSNNRSRFSLAFPNSETSLRREVDTLIAVAAELPSGFSDALDTIVNSVIAAEPLGRFHASLSKDVAARKAYQQPM